MTTKLNVFPKLSSHIRIIYACPDFGPIDIFINGKPLIQNCKFGEASKYLTLAPIKYKIEIFKTSDHNTSIFEYDFEAIPTMICTLCITSMDGQIHILDLKDNINIIKPNTSYLRFINLSPNAPLLSLGLPQSNPLFKDVEFCESTNYLPVTPKNYNFIISNSKIGVLTKRVPRVNLLNGEKYTIYIIGLLNGKPSLGYLFLKDM